METNLTDEELLKKAELVPTEQVEIDVRDTEAEIEEMEREAAHYERTPMSAPTARLDHMRASARRSGIAERKQFVANLRRILELRKSKVATAV